MRFSIICTNYNKEPYIAECIESVLNQAFTDFEFIVVDDASTDDSLGIIKEYARKDSRIQILENKENIGMAGSYNKAIPAAKGDLICLIDSDDFWFQNKLQVVHDYFETDSSCVMHQHPLAVYHFDKKTNEIFRPYLLSGNIIEYIKNTRSIPVFSVTTGLTFRSEIVKKVLPIPLSFHKSGEAFLTRTVICFGNVATTYLALGGYRKTDSNMVFGNSYFDLDDFVENTLKPSLNQYYKENNIGVSFKLKKASQLKPTFKEKVVDKMKRLIR